MARRTAEKAVAKEVNGAATAARTSAQPTPPSASETSKRSYLKQADVPTASLDEAMRLPQTIFDHYAGKPTSPFNVAKALNVDPKGSQLRVLSGAAIAYGLIEGGAQASTISVTDLARRIIRPRSEDEDTVAKREAVLKPRVFREFLTNYNGNQLPRPDIALNVLEEMGVPRDKAEDVFGRISDSARAVGFAVEIKGKYYIQLDNAGAVPEAVESDQMAPPADTVEGREQSGGQETLHRPLTPTPLAQPRGAALVAAAADDQRRRRVFITHGRDRALVDPIKKLLEYGELEPVVSVEKQSVSKPVPRKLWMTCGAAAPRLFT